MPQTEFFGVNSINNITKILKDLKPKKVFLVTGKKSYTSSGAKAILDNLLKEYDKTYFSDFSENPKIEDIEKGIKLFRKEKCDIVIAIGGGTVIDIAKSVNLLSVNTDSPADFILKNKPLGKKGVPLIAIPTTSGTGSEATKFAVIYIEKTKYSLDHELVLPDYAIIDPSFTLNLPKNIAAATGMDALSQAIESYWSIYSTTESKRYSKEAIRLILKNLQGAVNSPTRDNKEAMARGSNLAGKAINITKTTACHAISYPITSYFNIPHGHAVALTLPSFLMYNYEVNDENCIDSRGAAYVKRTMEEIYKLIGASSPMQAFQKIKTLMEEIGLETSLSKLNIKNIDVILEKGFDPSRVKNNPRRLTKDNLRDMLERIK